MSGNEFQRMKRVVQGEESPPEPVKGKSLRPTELAMRMGCEWKSSRAFTDKLYVHGLIRKKKVSKKCVLLSLSRKGRDMVAKFRGAMESMEATCLGDLPPSEIEIADKVIFQLLERSR